MTQIDEHERQLAEAKLRRELNKMQDIIFDYHCGDEAALLRARGRGLNRIMEAVQQNIISVPVAESLREEVQNWGY
jgi:predicted deacylase